MYRALLMLVWLFNVGYSQIPTFWLLAHPLAERWRHSRRSPYWVLVPAWMGEMALVAALTYPWHEVTLYSTLWTWIPSVIFLATAVGLLTAAHRGFTHEQLVGRSELESGRLQRLVTTGIRARVRHPVYLAHLCGMMGWALGSGLAVVYCLLAYALVGFSISIPMEDRELERRFGAPYREYRNRVPALLPRLT